MLTRLVPVETLQAMQNRFAALGRVSIRIVGVDQAAITTPTWGNRYAELLLTSDPGRAAWNRCSDHESPASSKLDDPCLFSGIAAFSAPVVHDGRVLATVAVASPTDVAPSEQAVGALATTCGVDRAILLEAARRVDLGVISTPASARLIAGTLAEMITAIFEQARRIDRQLTDLHTVYEIAELLAGTTGLEEILSLTVRRVVETMPVKASAIRLLDKETGELVFKAVHNLSDQYMRKGPVYLKDNTIDTAAFAGETIYIEDAPNDPRTRYPNDTRREGIVSGLCVPMIYRGDAIGVIRVYTGVRYRFSESEITLLQSIASQAASAIVNGRLYEEKVASDRFLRQVRIAGEIQRRMLPDEPPSHRTLTFGCCYVPTLEVGGDFYDFVPQADESLGLCVADVVGKGLPAALMMASVRAALRAYADSEDSISDVLAKVNRHMCRDTLVGEFATLIYGFFAPDGRTFRYANAGHTPPLLLRANAFRELETGGLVIGVQPSWVFDQETVSLHHEDILVMTTDGVTEAMAFDGEPYGSARLRASIKKHQALDAHQLAQQLLWDVRRFAGLANQSDDITIVVAKVDFG